jgi:serine/threonine protein kinase
MARSLFQILGATGDDLHARILAWLLDPHGEHGRGEELLLRLGAFLQQQDIAWPKDEAPLNEIKTSARLRDGVWEVALRHPSSPELLIVVGGHLPGAPASLSAAQQEGEVVIGFLLVPGAFPPETVRSAPVWTGQTLLALLDTISGEGLFDQVLTQYRDYLRHSIRRAKGGATTRVAGRPAKPGAAPAAAKPSREDLNQRLGAAVAAFSEPEEWPDEVDMNLEAEILPSDDMSRAYVVEKLIGRGGQGYVFQIQIQGSQEFSGFKDPVERAVLKIAREGGVEALELEKGIYEVPDRGIVKLLDSGIANEAPYMVLEMLQPHANQRFPKEPVHPAIALDTFIHLLGVLQGIHMRRERPLLLFDIKPDNVMLRMGSADLDDSEYRRRLATGAYEPVFMDMGCARERRAVESKDGILGEFIGTPAYLPPESVPQLTGEVEGRYGVETDVYALTASLCQLLTGKRPYEHRGVYELKGQDQLFELLSHKTDRSEAFNLRDLDSAIAPYDPASGTELIRIVEAGLHPDPNERASLATLLNMCRKSFTVAERRKKEVGDYHYDHVKGLRLWQTRLPRPKVK